MGAYSIVTCGQWVCLGFGGGVRVFWEKLLPPRLFVKKATIGRPTVGTARPPLLTR